MTGELKSVDLQTAFKIPEAKTTAKPDEDFERLSVVCDPLFLGSSGILVARSRVFFCPGGTFGNSPAIYRWVREEIIHQSWKDG
ncbi:MAG: hypothetical protein GXP24_07815 [Planctomycetes bacterium]|nr:hypothetical protein [Planctomycetota bacterium]